MSKTIETKICIIGAGPAGAILSLFLSKKKVSHVIIDKATFPRDKVCGDGYTIEVMRTLREYSEELYQEFVDANFTLESGGIYLEMANKNALHFDFKKYLGGTGAIYCGRREDFDNWLFSKLDKNYAEVYTNCEAKQITRSNSEVEIACETPEKTFTILCKLVVGADGERSIVRKTFHPKGIKKDREHHYAAIKTYYKGVKKRFANDPLEFYQPSFDYRGYFWVFHLPNGESNVGMGILSSDVAVQKPKIRKILHEYIEQHPDLRDRFKNAEQISPIEGWGIPLNSDATGFTGDHYLLLGDAAKFGEPFTGKGIGIAMYSAFLAVPTIMNCLENDDFSDAMLAPYESFIEKKYRSEWDQLVFAQNKFNKKYWFSTLVSIMSIKPVNKWFSKRSAKKYLNFVNKPFLRRKGVKVEAP